MDDPTLEAAECALHSRNLIVDVVGRRVLVFDDCGETAHHALESGRGSASFALLLPFSLLLLLLLPLMLHDDLFNRRWHCRRRSACSCIHK